MRKPLLALLLSLLVVALVAPGVVLAEGRAQGKVTDKDGKFTIKGLPSGKHTIQVWHSRVGWVHKKLEIEIKDGKVTSLGAIKVAADRFKR